MIPVRHDILEKLDIGPTDASTSAFLIPWHLEVEMCTTILTYPLTATEVLISAAHSGRTFHQSHPI